MKHLVISATFLLISCCTAKTAYTLPRQHQTVDHPQSYEYYDRSMKINAALKKHQEQTLILFHQRPISYKKLKKLMAKGKINSVENIKDRTTISSLGYSYDRVKTIILTKGNKRIP